MKYHLNIYASGFNPTAEAQAWILLLFTAIFLMIFTMGRK